MCRTALSIGVLVSLVGLTGFSQAQTPPPSAPGRGAAKPAVAPAINLNTASASDLEKLPGIGARTAGRIVEYRQKNGPFKKIEELMNVPGVGEKNFLKLRSQISVAAPKPERAVAQPQQ